jgi:outer membrane biosynthesis protein TonB
MGLWEFLRQWPRGRMLAGVLVSLLVHVLVTWAVLWGLQGGLAPQWVPRKGDTIIVELPKPEEPASAGSPAAPPPPAAARQSPPAPARPAPPPPRQAPAPPREERRVASAPRPAEPPPAPRAPEPAPRAPEPAPRAPEPAPSAAEPAPSAPQQAAEAAPRATPSAPEVHREPTERQVASLPPGGRSAPSMGDVRAALRQGAGGRGQGRGGIEGDPIPLDSADPRYSDYLEQIRRRIKAKWGFPCVRNAQTGLCDHYTTSLDVHFGILKDGSVQFVDVVKRSEHGIYDEYATRAILLAQPFPPVPPAMMAAMRQGSSGLAISARFSYVVESSLTNLLR